MSASVQEVQERVGAQYGRMVSRTGVWFERGYGGFAVTGMKLPRCCRMPGTSPLLRLGFGSRDKYSVWLYHAHGMLLWLAVPVLWVPTDAWCKGAWSL